jgi:hypothetical protein
MFSKFESSSNCPRMKSATSIAWLESSAGTIARSRESTESFSSSMAPPTSSSFSSSSR